MRRCCIFATKYLTVISYPWSHFNWFFELDFAKTTYGTHGRLVFIAGILYFHSFSSEQGRGTDAELVSEFLTLLFFIVIFSNKELVS